MEIGGFKPEYGVFLAPMAGFSDRAMRRVCRDMGAEYSVTEMISAKAVTFGDRKTYDLARIKEDEGPVGLQIFGSEPDVMAPGTAKVAPRRKERTCNHPRKIQEGELLHPCDEHAFASFSRFPCT